MEEEEIVMKDNFSFTAAMPHNFPINYNSESLVNYRITLILHQINETIALKYFTSFQNRRFIQTESLNYVLFKPQALNVYLTETVKQKEVAAL